jgi:peptidoglycan/LPS O-acetylase OafA/YrhL
MSRDVNACVSRDSRLHCRSLRSFREAAFAAWQPRPAMATVASPVFASIAELPRSVSPLSAAPGHTPAESSERSVPAYEPAAAKQRFYRPELDILRLIAFLMVWCAHASLAFKGLLPTRFLSLIHGAGSLGVPVFFFLSAYLITELLRREKALTGAMNLSNFYMRRVLRIWPLYFGIFAVYGLLGLRFHGFRIEPGRLLASILMAGNWYIAKHPNLTTPLRHLWSISVEEQWYLLWPLIAMAVTRERLLLYCGSLLLASQAILAYLACGHRPRLAVSIWVNSGVQFQYLALGAGVALLLNGRIPRLAPRSRAGLAALAAAAFLFTDWVFLMKRESAAQKAVSLCSGYLSAGVGSACLVFALLGVGSRYCPRILVRFGQLSYGLYVLHETGFFLAGAVLRHLSGVHSGRFSLFQTALCVMLALPLTVGLAFASYYGWELPFLRLKERWTAVRSGVTT